MTSLEQKVEWFNRLDRVCEVAGHVLAVSWLILCVLADDPEKPFLWQAGVGLLLAMSTEVAAVFVRWGVFLQSEPAREALETEREQRSAAIDKLEL